MGQRASDRATHAAGGPKKQNPAAGQRAGKPETGLLGADARCIGPLGARGVLGHLLQWAKRAANQRQSTLGVNQRQSVSISANRCQSARAHKGPRRAPGSRSWCDYQHAHQGLNPEQHLKQRFGHLEVIAPVNPVAI